MPQSYHSRSSACATKNISVMAYFKDIPTISAKRLIVCKVPCSVTATSLNPSRNHWAYKPVDNNLYYTKHHWFHWFNTASMTAGSFFKDGLQSINTRTNAARRGRHAWVELLASDYMAKYVVTGVDVFLWQVQRTTTWFHFANKPQGFTVEEKVLKV